MMRYVLLFGLLCLCPTIVGAQDPCFLVPGGCPPSDIVNTHLIPTVVSILIRLAGGLALIFMIWAGIQMVVSQGDTGHITTARNAMIYVILGVGFVMVSQLIVSFVATEGQNAPFSVTNADVELMAWVVRNLLRLFNVLFGIALFISGARMIIARGKQDEFEQARMLMIWSIVAAILINVSHALIQVVVSSLL